MTEKMVTVASSLAARSAALFVQLASQFSCKVQVKLDNKLVNGKSIMGLLSISVLAGQTVTIIAEGVDEDKAILELSTFLSNLQKE